MDFVQNFMPSVSNYFWPTGNANAENKQLVQKDGKDRLTGLITECKDRIFFQLDLSTLNRASGLNTHYSKYCGQVKFWMPLIKDFVPLRKFESIQEIQHAVNNDWILTPRDRRCLDLYREKGGCRFDFYISEKFVEAYQCMLKGKPQDFKYKDKNGGMGLRLGPSTCIEFLRKSLDKRLKKLLIEQKPETSLEHRLEMNARYGTGDFTPEQIKADYETEIKARAEFPLALPALIKKTELLLAPHASKTN